ncbi:unnamed protein product [Anisakis simplex]|uniref:Uncharacterized protein n=1 Tax=Anisakis simplex TaxID=6269 RepID=A0A0M3K579_ANISI|nr:unnamed protein product [Anisakis simplex]
MIKVSLLGGIYIVVVDADHYVGQLIFNMFLRGYSITLKSRRSPLANTAAGRRSDESSTAFGIPFNATRRSGSVFHKKEKDTRPSLDARKEDSSEVLETIVELPTHPSRVSITKRNDEHRRIDSQKQLRTSKKKRYGSSLDFPSAVIEMARRASSTKQSKRTETGVRQPSAIEEVPSSSELSSSVVASECAANEVRFESPQRRRGFNGSTLLLSALGCPGLSGIRIRFCPRANPNSDDKP